MKIRNALLASLSFALTALPVALAFASDAWIDFKSASGIYEARLPEDYKITSSKFLIDDKLAVGSEEASALVDQRPYKNAMKSYIVKYEQTFGPALTEKDVGVLLNQEVENYINYYKKFDGVIRDQNLNGYRGHWGGELYMSYKDPTFGVQSIRARIVFSDNTKLQQIVVGPDELMASYQTRDFFDSLRFEPGVSVVKDTFVDTWKPVESPMGIFSVLLPAEKQPPYYALDPVMKVAGNNEIVSLSFRDPVRGENVFFNIYSYNYDVY